MTTRKSSARKFIEKINKGPITFGQMIASLRKSDEVSQTALANKLHISKAHLCDIEKGRRMVSVERAIAFANALGYSPIQFATRALEDQLRSAGLNVQVHLKAV